MPFEAFSWSILIDILTEIWNSNFKVLIVLLLAPLLQLIIKVIAPFISRVFLLNLLADKENSDLAKKRIKTLSGVIEATSLVLIVVYVLIFISSNLGINLTPILAGAGIVSLAVGFGAQSLVKDVISGVFIILENQYNRGDWIKVDSYSGKVVEINLRRTVLQTAKGARHIIPNGRIGVVTNTTTQYSVVSLDIPAKVDENFGKISKIIDKVGLKLANDKNFKDDIIEAPEAVGVNEINDYSAIIKVWGKVKPSKQLKIKRELAERIATEFGKNKIELPGKIVQSK